MADAAHTTLSPAAHLSEHGIDVPPAVLSLLADLLAHDPDDRLPDAESVIERVEAVRADPHASPLERQSVSPTISKTQPFDGSMRIASAALLVLIAGVLAWWLLAGRSADPASDGSSTAGADAAVVEPEVQSETDSGGSEAPADAADVPPPPFPPGAVIDDSTTTPNEYVANIAETPDDVFAFYEEHPDGPVTDSTTDGSTTSFMFGSSDGQWSIAIDELALSTGAVVTRIDVRFVGE